MGEHLRVTHAGPVATVTIARPEVHNAFNEQPIAERHEAFLTPVGPQPSASR